MAKVSVTELEDHVLAAWVGLLQGIYVEIIAVHGQPKDKRAFCFRGHIVNGHWCEYHPFNSWLDAAHVFEDNVGAIVEKLRDWFGLNWPAVISERIHLEEGDSERQHLRWFMRAYVASQCGDEVDDKGHIQTRPPLP